MLSHSSPSLSQGCLLLIPAFRHLVQGWQNFPSFDKWPTAFVLSPWSGSVCPRLHVFACFVFRAALLRYPSLISRFHKFFLGKGDSGISSLSTLSLLPTLWLFADSYCVCCFTLLTLSFFLDDKLEQVVYFGCFVCLLATPQCLFHLRQGM